MGKFQEIMIFKMKRTICFLLFCVWGLSAGAQMQWNAQWQSYIAEYKDIAIEEMMKHHIPASITLAQGLLESGAGMSELVRKGNNHFGIKCHDWTGARTYRNDDEEGECFRVYRSARESFEDHSRFLLRERYKRLYALATTDYRGWARGLKECGYATDPQYATKLIRLIELYQLYRYDSATGYDHFMARHSGSYPAGTTNARLHPIFRYNENYYLRARQGDTFQSIAQEVELSARALARANERDLHEVLAEGDIVYLKKKRRRAERAFKDRPHVVKAGESLYDIAQRYGIRLKSLYQMNGLGEDDQARVGDRLRVY